MVTYNIRLNSHYGNTSCGVSRLGIQNLIVDFCLKMKCFKEFFHILLRRLKVAILSFSDIFLIDNGSLADSRTLLLIPLMFSPNIYIVTLVDTHMCLQLCSFYDSQGTEALPLFLAFSTRYSF